jgi:hypothetical protein
MAQMASLAGWRYKSIIKSSIWYGFEFEKNGVTKVFDIDSVSRGGIVAVVEFSEVISHGGYPWHAQGQKGFLISKVIPLKSMVPIKGRQNLWNVPRETELLVYHSMLEK